MKKYILVVSLMFLVIHATQAQSFDNIKAYGKAEIQAVNADTGVMKRVEAGNNINSIFSRLGVRGDYGLGGDVKIVFKFEWEVKGVDDDDKDDLFSARNTYIGLASKTYGQLLLGRNDTRFKNIEANVDQFKERESNLKQIFSGQDRIGDTITYIAPGWYGIQAGMTVVLGDAVESQNSTSGYSFGARYGDSNLKEKMFYVAGAFNKNVLGIDAWRVMARFKLGIFKVGGMYQSADKESENKSGEGYMLNVALPWGKHYEGKVQYSKDDAKLVHNEEAEMLSAGVDYIFSKQARVYLMATKLELETSDDKVVSVGLRYIF